MYKKEPDVSIRIKTLMRSLLESDDMMDDNDVHEGYLNEIKASLPENEWTEYRILWYEKMKRCWQNVSVLTPERKIIRDKTIDQIDTLIAGMQESLK